MIYTNSKTKTCTLVCTQMLFQNAVNDLGGTFLVAGQLMAVHTVRVEILAVTYNGF